MSGTDLDDISLDAELSVLDEGSPVRWVAVDRIDRPVFPEGVEALLTAEVSRRRGTPGR